MRSEIDSQFESGRRIRRIHRSLFQELPVTHPAIEFLEEFIRCRAKCVGREISGYGENAIDQTWFSRVDNKEWTFSRFAYAYLAGDVVLDGWLKLDSPPTATEIAFLNDYIPRCRTLLAECEQAAADAHNQPVLELVQESKRMLDKWEICILARSQERGKRLQP